MSVFTFTNSNMVNLTYELADAEIVNDVLMITGEAGSEKLVRGYDPVTIPKYGRRSYRVDRPLVDEAEAEAQVTAILDRNIEPYAVLEVDVVSNSPELIEAILSIKLSDKVTVQESTSGIDADFIVDGVSLDIARHIIQASYQLVQAR